MNNAEPGIERTGAHVDEIRPLDRKVQFCNERDGLSDLRPHSFILGA